MSVALEKPFTRGEEFTEEVAAEQKQLQAGGMSAERAKIKALDTVAAANGMTGEALEKYLDGYRQYLASQKTPIPVVRRRRRRKNVTQNGHNGLSLFATVEAEESEEPDEPEDLEEGEAEDEAAEPTALTGLDLPNDILLAPQKKTGKKRGGERALTKVLRQMKPGGVCLILCAATRDVGSLTGFLSTFSKATPGWRKPGPKPEGKPAYDTQRIPAYTVNGEPAFVIKLHRHD